VWAAQAPLKRPRPGQLARSIHQAISEKANPLAVFLAVLRENEGTRMSLSWLVETIEWAISDRARGGALWPDHWPAAKVLRQRI
jgi:hypothetical protein